MSELLRKAFKEVNGLFPDFAQSSLLQVCRSIFFCSAICERGVLKDSLEYSFVLFKCLIDMLFKSGRAVIGLTVLFVIPCYHLVYLQGLIIYYHTCTPALILGFYCYSVNTQCAKMNLL